MILKKTVLGIIIIFILIIFFANLFLEIHINKWILAITYIIMSVIILYTTYSRQK